MKSPVESRLPKSTRSLTASAIANLVQKEFFQATTDLDEFSGEDCNDNRKNPTYVDVRCNRCLRTTA